MEEKRKGELAWAALKSMIKEAGGLKVTLDGENIYTPDKFGELLDLTKVEVSKMPVPRKEMDDFLRELVRECINDAWGTKI